MPIPAPISMLAAALALLGLCSGRSPAQEVPLIPSPYRVAGHIVSAMDGRPLQHATIHLVEIKNNATVTTTSDEYGAYAFPSLAAGKYRLEGQATGYIASNYQGHSGYSTAIVTGVDGLDTQSLVLRLMPEGRIAGRVTDEAGDPVRRAQITLYRENRDAGELRITRVGFAQTDDLGRYDMGRRVPGRFYVSATATPWYAMHPQSLMQNGVVMPVLMTGTSVSVVEGVDPMLNMAYPTIFYPNATDSSGAQAIELHGGQEAEIDLQMVPVPAVALTMQTTPLGPDEKVIRGIPPLVHSVFGEDEPVNGTQTRNTANEIVMFGLPPGRYELKEPGGSQKAMTVDLTHGSVALDAAAAQPLGKVKIVLQTPDGNKLPPSVNFALIARGKHRGTTQSVNAKGEAEVNGLEPDDYSITVHLGNREYYVTQLLADGRALPANQVHVGPASSTTLTVTAQPASGRVEGYVNQQGKPAPGIMVLMLPVDPTDLERHFWKQQSDLDGSFDLGNIPPGRYTLLAIDDGWDLEWQNHDVIAPYLAKGVPVVIRPGSTAPVKLTDAVAVQAR